MSEPVTASNLSGVKKSLNDSSEDDRMFLYLPLELLDADVEHLVRLARVRLEQILVLLVQILKLMLQPLDVSFLAFAQRAL